MTITLDLPFETQRRLTLLATRKGKDVTSFVNELIETTIESSSAELGLTFDEIAAPLRQDFDASGLTFEEFDALVEEARNEVWQQSHTGADDK